MLRFRLRSVFITTLMITIPIATYVTHRSRYSHEQLLISNLEDLVGTIGIEDSSQGTAFSWGLAGTVRRHSTILSRNIPNGLHPEFFESVNEVYLDKPDLAAFELVSRFSALEKITIDEYSDTNETIIKFRLKRPNIKVCALWSDEPSDSGQALDRPF